MRTLPLALGPALLAAACGLAWGQSSVTIYGRVDLGLKYGPQDLTKSDDRIWAVDDSSTARLGLRGVEDLGGGLSAFFQLEHRFKADTGNVDGTVFWKDKAWVGLASRSWGSLQLGRMSSPQDNLGVNGRFEAYGGDSYASMGTRGAASAAKWDNAIYYTTPNLAGITVGLAGALGEGGRKHAAGFHLDYAGGPLVAALTYQVEQDSFSSVVGNGIKTWTLGTTYDFGTFKLLGTYARSADVNTADSGKRVVYTLGTRVPAGPGEFRASWRAVRDDQLKGRGDFSSDRDSRRLGLGYQYPFSKRTSANFSLLAHEKVKVQNANGSEKSHFSGRGVELALRHNF